MSLLTRNKKPVRIQQGALPAGIAYGWFHFAYSKGPRYVRGFEGSSLALIPVRDWEVVPDKAKLLDTDGELVVKGDTEVSRYITEARHGYLPVGFHLIGRPYSERRPVQTCLKCRQYSLVRQEVESIKAQWDRVMCLRCDMWWEEPFYIYEGVEPTRTYRLPGYAPAVHDHDAFRKHVAQRFDALTSGRSHE